MRNGYPFARSIWAIVSTIAALTTKTKKKTRRKQQKQQKTITTMTATMAAGKPGSSQDCSGPQDCLGEYILFFILLKILTPFLFSQVKRVRITMVMAALFHDKKAARNPTW
eukprot:180006_1